MHLKQNLFFCLFESKNWREPQKQILFSPVQIKNHFDHFWEFLKNIKQFLISNFLLGDCSLIVHIRNDSANFKKIFIFKVPAIFWKWKLCRAWRNLPIYLDWLHKMMPDQQKRVVFQKFLKSAKSLHLIVLHGWVDN